MDRPPELKPGDWLEHDAIKQRQRLGSAKRAEIIAISSMGAMLYLEGEPGSHVITRADLTRWWNYYAPPPQPEEQWPPPSMQESDEFYSVKDEGTYHAIVRTLRLGWVSYIESSEDFSNVFRIMAYDEFKTIWIAGHRMSVYDWLKAPAL